MKEFETAAREVTEDDDVVYEFAVDGTECKAYRPKDGQLAVLMATTTKHSSLQEQIAGVINFFVHVLDAPSHSYIVSRLLDHDDNFGIVQVNGIMEWLISEWSGRPTRQPSDFMRSQQSGGPKSTHITQPSISSGFPHTAS